MIPGNLLAAFLALLGLDKDTKNMRTVLFLGLLLMISSVMAEPVLKVAMHSIDLEQVTELGEIEIEGVGRVQLTAHRSNKQVVVKASGPGRELLGRAETTVGLAETPVYVRTPDGLRKITVVWGAEKIKSKK